MRNRVKEKVIQQPVPDACHHFWMIDVADGPTSRGTCKYCGTKKQFYNAFPDFNPMKRGNNPLALPVLPEVEVDKDSES